MLRKRTRSVQKDQHQMDHNKNHNQPPISDSGSESESFYKSDVGNKNPKNSSFYTIPGLLVGLSPKGLALTDCDSVRSPTSPLDFRLFSGLGNPFRSSSTRSSSHENGQQRSCVGGGAGGGTSKLGLTSIIDSRGDDMKFSGKVLRSSSSSSESSKNILFGPQLRINKAPNGGTNSFESPKSLPKNYAIFPHSSKPKSPLQKEDSSDVLFEIGDSPIEPDTFGKIRSCSLDSCRSISNLCALRNSFNKHNPNNISCQVDSPPQFTELSPNSKGQLSGSNKLVSTIPGSIVGSCGDGFGIGSLSASEIELSEDYTCVISHGPNPKTTHIFGDCILETHSNDLMTNFGNSGLSHPITTTTTTATNNPSSEIISVPYPSDDFLSFCYSCNKKLEDGKDIYIYRGEKAFCSMNCRSLEILIDEELEKDGGDDNDDHDVDENDNDGDYGKELFFETGLIATT